MARDVQRLAMSVVPCEPGSRNPRVFTGVHRGCEGREGQETTRSPATRGSRYIGKGCGRERGGCHVKPSHGPSVRGPSFTFPPVHPPGLHCNPEPPPCRVRRPPGPSFARQPGRTQPNYITKFIT